MSWCQRQVSIIGRLSQCGKISRRRATHKRSIYMHGSPHRDSTALEAKPAVTPPPLRPPAAAEAASQGDELVSSPADSRELIYLYRRLLRACATYPSKNRWGIYESIREEFKENVALDPNNPKTQKMVQVAYKGLGQLQMYDTMRLSKGNPESPNWEVTLEQNPMPKPPE